jgi:hypothetical protein
MGDHYVPAFYLKSFAADPDFKQIWAYKKGSDRFFKTNVINVANENDFYPDELETYLANEIEQPANLVIKNVQDKKNLSDEEKLILSNYMTVLWKRVPQQKMWIKNKSPKAIDAVLNQLENQLVHLLMTDPAKKEIVERRIVEIDELRKNKENLINEEFVRDNWAHMIPVGETSSVPEALCQMTWLFWITQEKDFFITCDNPVFYFPEMGIANTYSEVSFPITKKISLWATWRSDFSDQKYQVAGSQVVKELNRRTASIALEYIYSPIDEVWIKIIGNKTTHKLNRII